MGRMPKAADRLPAQRESVDIRALRAAIIEHEAELKILVFDGDVAHARAARESRSSQEMGTTEALP